MANRSRPHKQAAATPDDTAAQLRQLIREAHEAMSGLRSLIREATQLVDARADKLVDAAFETTLNAHIKELDEFITAESARISGQMTSEMVRARDWMIHNLELIVVTETPEGLRAEFNTVQLRPEW